MRSSVYCVLLAAAACIVACSSDDGGAAESVDGKVHRVASIVCGGDSMSFTYDDENRLTRCVDMGGTDTMSYRYDTGNGRIYTSYRWHHEAEGGYPGYKEYTDTLFLKDGIADSCAGWFAYGLSPEQTEGHGRGYSIKFVYDTEGQMVSATLSDLLPRGTVVEAVYEFVWADGNIAESTMSYGFMAHTDRCSYSYTSLPNQPAFGFTYDVVRSHVRQHTPLVAYGYFGRQSRNLPQCRNLDDGSSCAFTYTLDDEERLTGYSESWMGHSWDYEVRWETVSSR